MNELKDKMLGLRESTTQALDQPKPAYRVTGIDPKGGDIDEQFALIESEFAYGSPASDPTHRKIRVGDSLPEGEVTGITSGGIKVIPDYGDEYVIPMGGRPGYKPPAKKKSPPVQVKSALESVFDAADKLGVDPRTAAMLTSVGPFKFNPDGTIDLEAYKGAAEHNADWVSKSFADYDREARELGLDETFDPDDEEPGSFEDFKAEEADKYRIFEDIEKIDREPALWYDMETDTFVPYDPEMHGEAHEREVEAEKARAIGDEFNDLFESKDWNQ